MSLIDLVQSYLVLEEEAAQIAAIRLHNQARPQFDYLLSTEQNRQQMQEVAAEIEKILGNKVFIFNNQAVFVQSGNLIITEIYNEGTQSPGRSNLPSSVGSLETRSH